MSFELGLERTSAQCGDLFFRVSIFRFQAMAVDPPTKPRKPQRRNESSHPHVRKVRSALALGMVIYQKLFLSALPSLLHIVWVCSLDETEINLVA